MKIDRHIKSSGHIVIILEIKCHEYAATYAPDSDVSDEKIRQDLRQYGYGKRAVKGFRPYDRSIGQYL